MQMILVLTAFAKAPNQKKMISSYVRKTIWTPNASGELKLIPQERCRGTSRNSAFSHQPVMEPK
jgi:hypothetical protein